MYHVGQKLLMIDKSVSMEEYQDCNYPEQIAIRDKVYEYPLYVEDFIDNNPHGLSEEDLDIAEGFLNSVSGTFYLAEYKEKYTIFMTETAAYEVLSINDLFIEVMGRRPLPIKVEAVFLPFKDKIIYDGMIKSHPEEVPVSTTDRLIRTLRRLKAKKRIRKRLKIQ